MSVKNSELFTATDPFNHDAVTVLVDFIETDGVQGVVIRSLEGKYESVDEYMTTRDEEENPLKISSSLLRLTFSGAQRLVDALSRALQASEEG